MCNKIVYIDNYIVNFNIVVKQIDVMPEMVEQKGDENKPQPNNQIFVSSRK